MFINTIESVNDDKTRSIDCYEILWPDSVFDTIINWNCFNKEPKNSLNIFDD